MAETIPLPASLFSTVVSCFSESFAPCLSYLQDLPVEVLGSSLLLGAVLLVWLAVPSSQKNESESSKAGTKKSISGKSDNPFATSVDRGDGFPFWVVDGEPYDLTDFADKHPGGPYWFQVNGKRDISILFHTYHKDPRKLAPLLAKYKIPKDDPRYKQCQHENLLPKLGVPPFLLSPDYDARTDIPVFDFHNDKHLLNQVREQVIRPEFQKRVRFQNQLFDFCCAVTMVLYAINSAAFLMDVDIFGVNIPVWVSVVAYVVLRTSFGCFGHYYLHAKKPYALDVLFDVNYVGTSFVAADGHVMLHHAYTNTGADVKTRFFGGMWTVPQFYRPLAYTLHKLGNILFGGIVRPIEVVCVEMPLRYFNPWFWVCRAVMMAEFWMSLYNGKVIAFLIQFAVTLWFNTFLVLSSHDFEDFYEQKDADTKTSEDWGVSQIVNCHDMTLVGNKYLDMFLSAGLSSHRAHHLLPYQPSGFANIISEDIVRELLPKYGLEWTKPKVFWTDRAPYVFKFCFLFPTDGMEGVPVWRQHVSFDGFMAAFKFVAVGFLGIGAI